VRELFYGVVDVLFFASVFRNDPASLFQTSTQESMRLYWWPFVAAMASPIVRTSEALAFLLAPEASPQPFHYWVLDD
jgi:hypothetical protein